MKICFLTTGHSAFDDRIFHHFAKTLSSEKHQIVIISSKENIQSIKEGIVIDSFSDKEISKKKKIEIFTEKLEIYSPEIIICSENLPILAAIKYSKATTKKIEIILDITEWYPSKKNLSQFTGLIKLFQFIKFILFNIYTSFFVTGFIFGEYYKSIPYRFLFPRKKTVFVGYFPDLSEIKYSEPKKDLNTLNLTYSGKISKEKGYLNFVNVVNYIAENNSKIKINATIIGWYESAEDEKECDNLFFTKNINIEKYKRLDYSDFIKSISKTDIFLDLRSTDSENQHCLPIKLFYYIALKRPIIYSDLKAIRKEIKIKGFGHLVNPTDSEAISKIIFSYISDNKKYTQDCVNARLFSEKEYNWNKIKQNLITFVETI